MYAKSLMRVPGISMSVSAASPADDQRGINKRHRGIKNP